MDELEPLGPVGPVARQCLDEAEVRVGDEELGVGASHDHGADLGVVRELAGQISEGADEHGVEQVDGGMVEGYERDPAVDVDSQTFVLVRAHGPPPRSGNRLTAQPGRSGRRTRRVALVERPLRVGSTYW